MHNQNGPVSYCVVHHKRAPQCGHRVCLCLAACLKSHNGIPRAQPGVVAESALRRRTCQPHHSLADDLVQGCQPIRVSWQGFQYQGVWVLPAPFAPRGQQKGIERQMSTLSGPEIASSDDCCQRLPVSRSLNTSLPPIRPTVSKTRALPFTAALNTRAVLQYDHHVTAIGPSAIWSCTTPCCARIAAG